MVKWATHMRTPHISDAQGQCFQLIPAPRLVVAAPSSQRRTTSRTPRSTLPAQPAACRGTKSQSRLHRAPPCPQPGQPCVGHHSRTHEWLQSPCSRTASLLPAEIPGKTQCTCRKSKIFCADNTSPFVCFFDPLPAALTEQRASTCQLGLCNSYYCAVWRLKNRSRGPVSSRK